MNIFGLIVSGRLVQTDFEVMDETKCLITIPDADNINHVVVFLTGAISLPDGMAGLVYFSWPDPTAPPNWQLLGHISNRKPSAIFKISALKKLHEITDNPNILTFGQQQINYNAQIGISIEPISNAPEQPDASSPNSYLVFGQKMLQNFYNFIASFAVSQTQMLSNPAETYVPMSTLQTWYNNFERRLIHNPNFWK